MRSELSTGAQPIRSAFFGLDVPDAVITDVAVTVWYSVVNTSSHSQLRSFEAKAWRIHLPEMIVAL